MNLTHLKGILLSSLVAATLLPAGAQPLALSGNTYTNTFDDLESLGPNLKPGWALYTGASATALGSRYTWAAANYLACSNAWAATTSRFANQASTFSYLGRTNFLGTESTRVQTNELNRCLAVRQSSGFGDPGAAFVLQLQDTLNRRDFQLYVDLLNLDATSTRTTTWTVDYGLGDAPSQFLPLTTFVNTPGAFTTTRKLIALPNGTIDNQPGPVWLRIAALSGTTGSGRLETFGLDNFGLTWASGAVFSPAALTAQPVPAAAYLHDSRSFSVGAAGTEPLTYVWVKDGTLVLNNDGHFSGTDTRTLTITNLQVSDRGTYSCIVSNASSGTVYSQTSSGAALTVDIPPAASINYLHTLVDPSTFLPTNSSLLFQASGLITTATNITATDRASYYLQDGTGGINLYAPASPDFRPNLGDVVMAVGFLSSYGGNLEFVVDVTQPAQSLSLLSNNIAQYPVARVLPSEELASGSTNATLNYQHLGAVVMLTDVHFGTNAGVHTSSAADFTCVVTNARGQTARLFFPCSLVHDLTNRTLPAFAYAVQGPLRVNASAYEVMPTRWVDVLTAPITLTVSRSGTSAVVTWPAVPLSYSYTVLGASNVAGPYSVLATGLRFPEATGTYTDAGADSGYRFYRVTSP